MDFRFTRHILSCNNIGSGKIFGKDYEPGLSILGIIEAIMFAQKKPTEFYSYDVCVSNLYRTWCTAFILYGTNLKKGDILNLWVCPYLKENVKGITASTITGGIIPKDMDITLGTMPRGNFPKAIQHMASKFLIFLQLLYEITKNDDLKNKLKTVNNIEIFMNDGYNQWYEKLPDEIILRFPTNNDTAMYSGYMEVDNNIIYKKDGQGKYMILKNCLNYDLISDNPKTNKEEWLQNGDLRKFMEWFNNNSMLKSKTIHAVTHSGTMRNYLKSLGIIIKSKEISEEDKNQEEEEKEEKNQDVKLNNIRITNCWTFVTNAEVICLNNIIGDSKKVIIENLYNELFNKTVNTVTDIKTNEAIEAETKNIMNKLNKYVNNPDIESIVKSVVSEKYGFEINNNTLKEIKPLVKLLLLMVSLEKGIPKNPQAKPIELFFKTKNKSLCSFSGTIKNPSRKTPIQCSKGMNGGKKTRRKKRRKTRKRGLVK